MVLIGRLLGLVLFVGGLVPIAWIFAGLDPASPAFQAMLGTDQVRQAVAFLLLHGWTLLLAGTTLGVAIMLLLMAQLVRENT
jgi:hypothetical protein